jgi:hypothetical protein
MKFKSSAQRKAVMAKFKYAPLKQVVYMYPEQAKWQPFAILERNYNKGKKYYKVAAWVEEKDLNKEGN